MRTDVFPNQGEIVLATVKKTTQFGAFCTLDEYNGQDSFIHVSEVSSGWVRSVRDHVKEGQKVVALVLRVDPVKRQVDLSLKRLSEAEKKRKMEAYSLDKRATKLLERAAIKLGGKKPIEIEEVAAVLKKGYGDLYSAFELASQEKPLEGISKQWAEIITEVAKQEIKQKFVSQRVVLKIKSYAPNGLEQVKKILNALQRASTSEVQISVRYIGAPTYYLDITAPDYKVAEKTVTKLRELTSSHTNELTECQIEAGK